MVDALDLIELQDFCNPVVCDYKMLAFGYGFDFSNQLSETRRLVRDTRERAFFDPRN